ncbi:MAG: glycosyltransferase family 4 protein [Candidatus Omnitrophica bacterium]|nr:glycosyltransferase family 4 protein [Candidatus Omnitrophota bacterium]
MRICHVITKPELGGAQLSTLNILANLPKDKCELFFVTSSEGILKSEFKGLKGVRSFFSPFLVRQINPLYDILALIHIYLIYIRYGVSLAHTHSSKAGIIGRWAAKFAGVPRIVHTVHGWSFNDYQPLAVRKIFIFLERITAVFTTRIICVSKRDMEIGIKYNIAPKEKFALIKYGVSLTDFQVSPVKNSKKREELGIRNNDPVIGMIACLKPQKSPLDYINAAINIYAKIPNVNFLLVGDGVLREKCKRALAVSSLNGRFILTGWRRDVSEIMDILDIVVLTSKWEGMPIAIIEALSKGCPVVATNAGGTPELLKDSITGYLTRPGAPQEITDRVLEMLSNPERLLKMKQEAALSIGPSFGIDRMVSEVESLYRGSI